MSSDAPHIKAHREATHKTQADIAKIVSDITGQSIQQSQISRWEDDPGSIPTKLLRPLATALGVALDELFEPPRGNDAMMVDPGRPYLQLRKNVGLLRACLESSPGVDPPQGVPDPKQVNQLCVHIERKPNVVLAGHFDAGKSRLVNAMLGGDYLPAKYRPTTAASTWIRHIDDRPEGMTESVYIFPGDADVVLPEGIAKLSQYAIAQGGLEILPSFATHKGQKDSQREGDFTAVLFIDAPILCACNIIDLPGHAHSTKDANIAVRAMAHADILVYLSRAAGFVDSMDMVHIRGGLRQLRKLETNGLPLLSNFFVVASHVHPGIPDEELRDILDDGAKVLLRELGETVLSERYEVSVTEAVLRSRIFPFWFERPDRREELRTALRDALGKHVPMAWLSAVDAEVEAFRSRGKGICDRHIDQYRRVLNDIQQANRDLEERRDAEPKRKVSRMKEREVVRRQVHERRAASIKLLDDTLDEVVNEGFVTEFIKRRYNNKKDAQKHVLGAVIDLIQHRMVENVKKESEALTRDLERFIGRYDGLHDELRRPDGASAVRIEFDARGVFLGGMASAGVAGALSVWAASLGNLGGYIIVAKAASVLSSLGLGIGSAKLVTFVSMFGGPAMFGGVIVAVAGWAIYALFGEAWQKRLARQVVDAMKKNNVRQTFQTSLLEHWDNTARSFDLASDHLEAEYTKQLDALCQAVANGSRDRAGMERLLEAIQRIRDFFGGLPWKPVGTPQ